MYRKKADDDLLSDEDKPTYLDILSDYLGKSQQLILQKDKFTPEQNKRVLDRIKKNIARRQDKIYNGFIDDEPMLLKSQWKHMSELFPRFKMQVKKFADQRIRNVYKQLRTDALRIQEKEPIAPIYSYEDDSKREQIEVLKGQSQQIRKKLLDINKSLSNLDSDINQQTSDKNVFASLYSQEKKKEYEEYIRKKNEEKVQRHRKIDEQKRRQEQEYEKRQSQQKIRQQSETKQRKQQFLKRQMELHKIREQEKKHREMRNSEYIRIRKSLKEKPPLYKKIVDNFKSRIQYEEMEKRHRVLSQNKERYRHIDEMNIDEHEKNYESLKKQRQEQRIRKLEQAMEQQKRSMVRHISMQIPKQIDKQLADKEMAKQKQKKIKEYQEIVKQNFKPKINEEKRKQMLAIIEELELNSKRLKKNKLQNGSVVYEEITDLNPREIGMRYLQKTKEMAAKARMFKSASVVEDKTFEEVKKKPLDYLAERRKIVEQNGQRATSNKRLSVILGRNSHLSFDEKLNKVESEAQKLKEQNKQNEMRLKFGKFSTSDQILNCKEEIDQNYLEIAKMKLKLIKDNK